MNSLFTFVCAPSNSIFLLLPTSRYEKDLAYTRLTGDWERLRMHANADYMDTKEDIDRELLHINPLRYIWSHPSNVGWASAGMSMFGAVSYRFKSIRPLIWINIGALGFRLGQYKYPSV